MVAEKEIYIVDGKNYTVITKTKENANSDEIYNILVRYAIEKIDEYLGSPFIKLFCIINHSC